MKDMVSRAEPKINQYSYSSLWICSKQEELQFNENKLQESQVIFDNYNKLEKSKTLLTYLKDVSLL